MPKNATLSDDISVLTTPMMPKFPNATADTLMAHSDLHYEDIRVGNKGAYLNYNLLGQCPNKGCTYRHSKAKPNNKQSKSVAEKLGPAIASFMTLTFPTNYHTAPGYSTRPCRTQKTP
jgi:hypothetical protein